MNEKKKILFVITKSNWGGAQRYVYDLAINLSKEKIDVAVGFGQPGRLAEELQKAGIQTHPIASLQRDVSIVSDVRSFFELLRLFQKLKPDVVHLNSSKAGGVGALAGHFAGIKIILYTAHGWPFWEDRFFAVRGIIWFFSWLTALLTHTTICVSDYDLRVAKRMPLVGRKAIRIYNGIDAIDCLRRQNPSSTVRILTNAELHPNKNLFTAIDAVALAHKQNDSITYDIMSDGEQRAVLQQYIDSHNLGGFVSLLGFVPDGRRQYKNYDIFFLPSKKEGLPYVLLEAGLAELPVVASRVGGISEIIEDGISGILKQPTDVGGFANALEQLSVDSVLRKKLSNALKKKVEQKFSFQEMLDKTFALYYK